MTYLELQTEVRENIIDLPTTVTNRVPKLINRAIKELQQRHNFQVMAATQTFLTTINTRSIGAVPSDLKEWRVSSDYFPFWLEETGNWHKLSFISQNAARLAFEEILDIGSPISLVQSDPTTGAGAATVNIYPLPDGNSDYSDGEYRIYAPYWKYLPDLSANGDTNWFTVNADEYIIMSATANGFLADWDEDRMAIWRQLAEEKYDKVVKADKKFMLSNFNTLVPSGDVFNPNIRM